MQTEEQENNAVEQAPAQETGNENKAIQLNNSKELSAILAASDSKVLDKAKPVLSLNQTTFELKAPGDSIRALFWGIGTMSVTDKQTGEVVDIPAVQLIKDKQIHLNGGVNLVGTFQDAKLQQGTAVEVKLREITSKNVKIYDVTLLS